MEEVFPKSVQFLGMTVKDTVVSTWITMLLIIVEHGWCASGTRSA